jgi:dihydrofolate reductase
MELIYATDINNGLSKNGFIPWSSMKDLKFFYNITKHNIVIMGKNTYFSLPETIRPLKNRLNIVLSREVDISKYNQNYNNLIFTNNSDIHKIILNDRDYYKKLYPFLLDNFKIIIIGGKNVYEQFIPLCNVIWRTIIKKNYDCDLFLDCHLFLEYDYNNYKNKTVIEEDEELIIYKYGL